MHQNIVQEVHTWGRNSDRQEVRDVLATLLFDKENASYVDAALVARLDENASAVLDERRILLEIEPVYGAYVLLLAASIEWLDPKRP